jgi:hypothetical protein
MKEPLTVECAAIFQHGIMFWMPRPARHGHLIQAMAKFGCTTPITIIGQGFKLSDVRFATRRQAKRYAYQASCSEDLW